MEVTDEMMKQVIKETIDSIAPNFSAEDKQAQVDALEKVFIEGQEPWEAMGFDRKVVEGLYTYAYNLYNSGKYRHAAAAFLWLKSMDPIDTRFALGLAASYHKMKDYIKASSAYAECATMDPDDPMPCYYLSDCFLQKGATEGAIACLKMAVERAKDNDKYKEIKKQCKAIITNLELEIKKEKEKTKVEAKKKSETKKRKK